MAITEVSGFPKTSAGSAGGGLTTTYTIVPVNLGDLFVICIDAGFAFAPTGVTAPGINSGGAMTKAEGTGSTWESIWVGTVTTTGSQTATATWPSTPSGDWIAVTQDELTTGTSPTWTVITGNELRANNGTSLDYPSLTSGNYTSQAYWGYMSPVGATASPFGGSTSGFTYTSTDFASYQVCFNGTLAASTAYAPVGTATTGGACYTSGFIVATGSPISHTVTFNANGGTGSMSPETESTATALTANAFTRSGYTFSVWNTAADGSGSGYANNGTYPFTADATLYAQWTLVGALPITGSLATPSRGLALVAGPAIDGLTGGSSGAEGSATMAQMLLYTDLSQVNALETFSNGDLTIADWETPWVIASLADGGPGFKEWLAASPTTRQVILTLNLVPGYYCNPSGAGYTSSWWTAGAAGSYNSYATALATNLVSAGFQNSVIRMGAEMNGTWDVDRLPVSSANWPAWVGTWQEIITTMRAVSGANFLFCWNVNSAYQNLDFASFYPGDTYVDIIGIDQYDAAASVPDPGPTRWAAIAAQADGPTALAAFAATHSKPVAVPEWGTVSSGFGTGYGGDDGYFVAGIAGWMASIPLAFQCYYNSYGADVLPLDPSVAPNTLAAYKAAFAVFAPGAGVRAGRRLLAVS
jgi:beta-mannanase